MAMGMNDDRTVFNPESDPARLSTVQTTEGETLDDKNVAIYLDFENLAKSLQSRHTLLVKNLYLYARLSISRQVLEISVSKNRMPTGQER
jgi:hypothetical protein